VVRVRVLLTGAAGFVVANAVVRAAAAGAEVVALDLGDPHPDVLARLGADAQRVTWRRGDVGDRAAMVALVAEARPDAIVHGAALTPGDDEERADPARVVDVNLGGTVNLLEAARRADVGTFVFLSSTGLYGARPPEPAAREDEPLRPTNGYAIAKLAGEQLVARYATLTGLRGRVARVATAYGPLERASATRPRTSSVARAVAAALTGRHLRVAGADVARDFVHVDDVAEALWRLATRPEAPDGVVHVGPARAEPLAVALDALAAAAPGFAWTPVADPGEADLVQVPEQARAGLDLTGVQTAIGWAPRYDLAAGVVATWRWAREAH
jgi:nucleoside-diphosphate-sugar epimerase